ncbi:type II toxin-antitoxin system antitoxin SocA domain-containing protein [Niallia circulans]
MAEVRNVAKYFLSKSIENTQYAITPLKLQKLLYYAQGIHLRDNNGTPLFDENLLRWDHGPVNRIIYDDYKRYGYFTIPKSPDNAKNDLTKSEIKAIEQAWELYGSWMGNSWKN